MPYASLNNCELFYQTAGHGTPLVYIHGGFASLETLLRARQGIEWDWEYDFAATFQFISYDRRGCYRSSSPDAGYDLVTEAHDLAALLDHLVQRIINLFRI
jgi:pimeloyl-ACP methyl ester carboxylesterase